jgi:hypothetical protein
MRSIASGVKEDRKRLDMPGEIADEPSEAPNAEDGLVGKSSSDPRLDSIEACISDDPDLASFYLAAVTEGCTKREDIAACLGWTSEKVSVIRKKLLRRLHEKGALS